MNTTMLKVFVTVAEEGGFSRAADRLGLTQPAVSISVRSLEEELGVPLFDRSPGRCRLTSHGARLLEPAREILDAEERLRAAARGLQEEPEGSLEVVASNIPGEYLLPRLIRGFRSVHPQVEVKVTVTDSREALKGLREGAYELGFIGEEPKGPGWNAVAVGPDRLVLVAAPGHPLAGRVMSGAGRLKGEYFVLREEGSATRALMLSSLKEAGLDRRHMRVAAELGSTSAVLEAVQAGVGLSMLSLWSAEQHLAAGELVPLQVKGLKAEREFLMVHRKDRHLSRSAQAFYRYASASRDALEKELLRAMGTPTPRRPRRVTEKGGRRG
jgi:DNA-binding transcriptional LysR family regulator